MRRSYLLIRVFCCSVSAVAALGSHERDTRNRHEAGQEAQTRRVCTGLSESRCGGC